MASKFDLFDYYKAIGKDPSDLSSGEWYLNYDKRHAFSVSSDFDAIDEVSQKVRMEQSVSSTNNINIFSDKINNSLENTRIIANGDGTERVELEFSDRIITIIVDQSGSMTWNDNPGYRHDIIERFIRRIDENYGGSVFYNLIKFGSVYTNILFFGMVQTEDVDIIDLNSLKNLMFADPDSNFAGIRIVKNSDHYPNSYIDGEVLEDNYISKIFDDDVLSNQTYYYTVYTYDSDYHFSEGVRIEVVPRRRIVPRGVSIFKTWISSDEASKGNPFLGSGVIKDDYTIGLWHFDEGKENTVYDFNNNKKHLTITDESYLVRWENESFVPSGESALRFDGENTAAYVNDSEGVLGIDFTNSGQITIMAWIYPYTDEGEHFIVSAFSTFNPSSSYDQHYVLYQYGKYLRFQGKGSSYFSTNNEVIGENRWQHVAVTYDNNTETVLFYVDGILQSSSNADPSGLGDSFLSNNGNVYFSIGASYDGGNFGKYFYGKITEVSIHSLVRNSDYINKQSLGTKGDNGDRIVVLNYTIPEDYNFEEGEIVVVKNKERIPTWEKDGIILSNSTNVQPGNYSVVDSDDFLTDSFSYYRIYSRNTIGNYSFSTDSPFLQVDMSKPVDNSQWLELSTPLTPPEQDGSYISLAGNKKVYLRWKNTDAIDDSRVVGIRIYYSFENDIVVSDFGVTGNLLFSGLPTNNSFVHRNLSNDEDIFYKIVNVDKFDRPSSTFLQASARPSSSALGESQIPLPDVQNLHYQIVSDSSISIGWDQAVKNIENVEAHFDETVLLYSVVIDDIGQSVSDDALVEMVVSPSIERLSAVDDVFEDISAVEFEDADSYSFSISKLEDGIVKGTLSMTSDVSIMSVISKATFEVRLKSYIPDSKDNTKNVFEYLSEPVVVTFTNPWKIELVNRDNQLVTQRCYVYDEEDNLKPFSCDFNGVYVGSSSPFVARAKLSYKGEPVPSGSVDVAIWDADVDLCSDIPGVPEGNDGCFPSFIKTNRSETVLLPANNLIVRQGFEGEVPISYVDIPISPPTLSQKTILYAKSSRSGFDSLDSLNIVFQSTLRIEFSHASAPKADGTERIEQIAVAYNINTDHPNINDPLYEAIPVPDLSVVQWELSFEKAVDVPDRHIYSIDNVPISNGVYSYTRNGVARNVFFGPVQNLNKFIREFHVLSASIVYNNESSTVSQKLIIQHNEIRSESFGARFLMEMEDFYLNARRNKLWTDGIHYKKMFISRDPNTANIVGFSKSDGQPFTSLIDIFRNCVVQEQSSLFELNQYGQIVHIMTPNDNIEILSGEVVEIIDEYTGERTLETNNNTQIDYGDSYIQLNDYDPDDDSSDTTVIYIRANSFDGSGEESCPDVIYQGFPKLPSSNLSCLRILEEHVVDFEGAIDISGETTLFINGEPFVLMGGGNIENGVPPCLLCFNEPLHISFIWIKIDNVENNTGGTFIVSRNSIIDVRVSVSFANEPVPDGTLISVLIGNNDGTNLFVSTSSSVQTFLDESENRSYADIRIQASRMPEQTTKEEIKIISTYDKAGKTDRSVELKFDLEIIHEDAEPTPTPTPNPDIPEKMPTTIDIFSKDVDDTNIFGSGKQRSPMQVGRGDAFAGVVRNDIFVIGGLKNNNFDSLSITPVNEKYNISEDEWTFESSMPLNGSNGRYGGMTVVVGDDIYCIGGIKWSRENNKFEVTNELEVYHPLTNTWDILSSMPTFPREGRWGVSMGVAEYIPELDGSQLDNYIYVLCGISDIKFVTRSYGSKGDTIVNSEITKLNNRIFRYDIDLDEWTSVEITNGVDLYQRISPLSIVDGSRIMVFNGAWNEGKDQNGDDALIYHKDAFSVNTGEVISENIYTTDVFAEMPVSKYHSAIVRNEATEIEDYLREGFEYYVIGGSNVDSGHLNIVEKIDSRYLFYNYSSSYDENSTLPFLSIGKNGVSAVFAYEDDEYGIPAIFVLGGFTDGTPAGKLDIIIL